MNETLNHSPGSKPLYAQLYEILLNRLHSGEYKKDTVLPTEAEFQELFGVSRITARRALAELVNKGYLKRERGIGTLVIRNSEKQSINVGMKLMDCVGVKVERKNLSLEMVIPPPAVADFLQISSLDTIPLLTRVISREGSISTQVNYIYLSNKLSDLRLGDLTNGLYAALEKKGENINAYREFISAEIPTKEDCEILHIKENSPLLVKTRVAYNLKSEPIEYSVAKHISNFYQYVIETI